ncbi:unnamed protein product [Cuscuta campestris]|uniref:Exopolygalacturonase-like n=1 Tax=Cuscuta campestris TaxID=132261 RepID=A0A484M2J1_9ASTE|nr:unnamed protein product [Cuscuta campestris]
MGSRVCLAVLFVKFLLGFAFLFSTGGGVDAVPLKVFDVRNYGAKADGKTDNAKAFLGTWKDACEWNGEATLSIPEGEYMVGSLTFVGPCLGSVKVNVEGTVKAPTDPKLFFGDTWIDFRYVNGLVLEGGGTFDGQGASAWRYNDCSKNPNCPKLPASVGFAFVNKTTVQNINSINSKNLHFNVFACNYMVFNNVTVTAPGDSPNTDGIHIGKSTNVRISSSVIATGDDCISMVSGSENISVSDVTCGPGHGISIGSMGKSEDEFVRGVHIKSCRFLGTQNGVRIKTWAPSYPSKVDNVVFEDVVMTNVNNPIFIDQQYCPSPPCSTQASSVQIRNVTFQKIRGSSSSREAVILNCSKKYPCQEVKLIDINLVYNGRNGPATSSCSNVRGNALGQQLPPVGCLL